MITQQQAHGFLACLLAVASSHIFQRIALLRLMVEKY
jgi:hypothetical protein